MYLATWHLSFLARTLSFDSVPSQIFEIIASINELYFSILITSIFCSMFRVGLTSTETNLGIVASDVTAILAKISTKKLLFSKSARYR